MKLTDLDARFFGDATDRSSMDRDSIEGAQGLRFQCPKCGEGKESGEEDGRRFLIGVHSIRICFSNPRGAPVASDAFAGNAARWKIESGTSLDDLTLSPSINYDIPWKHPDTGVEYPSTCKFHGYIKNGDAS